MNDNEFPAGWGDDDPTPESEFSYPEGDPYAQPPHGLAWDDQWATPSAPEDDGNFWSPASGFEPGTGYDRYGAAQHRRSGFARHAGSVALAAAAAVMVAAAGFGIGQTLLSNQSSPASVGSSPSFTIPNNGLGGSGNGSGSGSSGGNTTPGSGSTAPSGSGGSATPGAGDNSGSGGALDVAALASKVDPGIVDVNTTLAYQGGEAAGTGIVLTSSGEVLTNNHVINGATSISVTDLGNGKTYSATVVGYDVTADIAILQLKDASGLQTVTLGDSSKVEVGAAVVALGNAGGAGGTPSVSSGTVTALNQSITASDEADGSSEQLTGLIQTNAALQSGDSGGPLVDVKGNVIAIDTATSVAGRRSRRQPTAGGGEAYAVPINTAISVAKQIESGKGSDEIHIGQTAFLGVEMQPLADGSGAVVAGVEPNTAAQKAGLQAGDVITSFGGKTVDSSATLSTLTGSHSAGDKVQIGWNDASGNAHSATVTLGAGPAR